jgi:hypothetical protein
LVLKTKDEAEAIRQANLSAQREAAKPITAALPPVVTITSPEDGFRPPGTLVQIDYSLRSPSGSPIDRLDVLADGRPVEAVGFEKTTGAEAKGHVVAEVPKTAATLSVIAYSGPLTSAPVSVKLTRDRSIASLVGSPKASNTPDTRPKLFAAVVFLSGHGIKDTRQSFWFLTSDADLSRLRATAISNDDLADILNGIPTKKVLFIDACHAGAAMVAGLKGGPEDVRPDMNKLVDDFAAVGSGLVVYAASTGSELAHEDEKGRHGAFAEALVEAIGQGRAESDENGGITIDLLDHYLERRVKELTGGDQHPVMNRNLIPDFPLAVARR